MFRWKRMRRVDPKTLRKDVDRAREQARQAHETRQEVEASTGEIMGEVRAHKVLLRRNNFAANLRAALGGER